LATIEYRDFEDADEQETRLMSFLVRLPETTYRDDALKNFRAVDPDFTLGNAQAMMWLSQLAYETDDGDKIGRILKRFGLELLDFGANEVFAGFFRRQACFIVARGQSATFIAFAGTDPLKPQDVITDLTATQTPEGLHMGFADAVASVRSEVEKAIKSGGAGQPLFFTGHSLGGALATISAMRARDAGFQVKAVYTYGGARAGGRQFFDSYGPGLRNCTFRLVYGKDIVASVPPSSVGGLLGSLLGEFHHVGRLLHCRQHSFFAEPAPTKNDGNEPDDFLEAGINAVLDIVGNTPSLKMLQKLDPPILDDPNNDLPEEVRDHVPASYFRALQMPLSA
jgi:triacylglycerol lipase